jgi:hypothetical protein
MRIATLACACALSLFASEVIFAFDTAAQNATPGMGGAPSSGVGGGSTAGMSGGPSGGGASGGAAGMKPNSVPLPAPEKDPAARSARSIECAQKADAQGLQGKPRKHFLHECRSGV